MMNHRKKQHGVQTCQKFLEGICKFQSEFCWYEHKKIVGDSPSPSVFQKTINNPKPPSMSTEEKEENCRSERI